MPLQRALETASISWLINTLATKQVLDYLLKWGIDEALSTKLRTNLLKIYAVLNHSEEKQVENIPIKAWIVDAKNAVYDAEDLLDEIATDALESQNSTRRVRNLIYDSVNANELVKEGVDFKVKDVVAALNPFKERVESKMKRIIEKLEDCAKQKDILSLTADVEGELSGTTKYFPTTPLVVESRVYGREADKEKIVNLLISGEENSGEVSVIPILGLGGIGKTTLAQIVYNDEPVKGHFDLRAWACVSDVFDVVKITKALLESASKRVSSINNLELLQEELKNKLNKRKFLLVLDDVWNEKYGNWDKLRIPFFVGAPGSRIIVTTRNQSVASIMGTISTYHLKELSADDCWSLLEQNAFPNSNSDAYPHLKVIGKEIAKKCKGLPLAAKALGGLLKSELTEEHWKDILDSRFLKLENSDITPALRLSYHHLPAHLKRCFAYCSMFPKDYEFEMEKLVLLWMAEGFVHQPEENKTIEDMGRKYFSELVSRSFFQQCSGDKSQFVMHDLIHDLAQSVSEKLCLRLEDNMDSNIFEKTRHLSYIRTREDAYKKFHPLLKVECLRTFLPLDPLRGFHLSSLSKKVPRDLLMKLFFLRVLSLKGYFITELPDSIGGLKHLRYLDLSHSFIEELPESINGLYNLQTLILYRCLSLTVLTTDMGSLVNLRHLNTSETGLEKMPLHMGKLISLQTLTDFVVGKGSCSGIGEFKNLSRLHGRLSISGLHNVVNIKDAIEAKLEDKRHLDELILEWSSSFDSSRSEIIETEVLDALQPHQNLKKLTIRYYGGTEFPFWMLGSSVTNIVYLHLFGCKKCTILPSLGQLPSLTDLIIEGMDCVKNVGHEFYGDDYCTTDPFPKLETLEFKNMKEWEEWSSFGEDGDSRFPCLNELLIFNCPKLRKFSHRFASLKKLRIKKCEALTSFSKLPSLENLEYEEFPCLKRLNLVGCNMLSALPDSLPSLEGLEIDDCEKLAAIPRCVKLMHLILLGSNMNVLGSIADVSSLTSLRVNQIQHVKYLPKGFLQRSTKLEELKIEGFGDLVSLSNGHGGLMHLASLQRLTISHCPILVSLPDEEKKLPPILESLDLRYCHSLKKLPLELYKLKFLKELRVDECPNLECFPDMGLPPMLQRLVIQNCGALKTLPEGVLSDNTSLEYLEILKCSSLVSFLERGNMPTTLKHVRIYYCDSLKSLPEGMMNNDNMTLWYLEINGCSLEFFPTGQLPTTLVRLEISNCDNLKSLPISLLNLRYLDRLEVTQCPFLEYFPKGGLPTSNLTSIRICECQNLKSLPERIRNVKCLLKLEISGCSNLQSLPKLGLPTNLRSLIITDCEKLNQVHEWNLHRLTSLQTFSIGGIPGLVSFSNEYLLPHSITDFSIKRLPDLESISEGLQSLTSLESLLIKECDKLKSLPEGLPSTLSSLTIHDCPLLKRRCKQDGGEDWHKIENIPFIDLS